MWFKKRLRLGVTVLLLLLALAACGGSPTTNTPQQTPFAQPTPQPTISIAQADMTISQLLARNAFSGSVLVASHGKILLDKGYSMANWQQKLANAPQTQFAISGMTKTFTAAAILLLQQAGKLNVQDPLCKYITACPSAWLPMTLNMLLANTSGLPQNLSGPDVQATLALPTSAERNITYLKKESLAFPPGAAFGFSNTGYIVLGAVIEKLSGQRYADFIRQHIFQPLHMNHTVVVDSQAAAGRLTSLAVGYQSWQTPANIGSLDFLSVYAPAVGIVSTVEDLYLWLQALSTQNLLSQSSLSRLFMDQGSTNTLGSLCTNILPMATSSNCPDYAYAWFLGKEADQKAIESVAFFAGYAGYMQYFPDDNYVIVVLSNLQSADFSTVGPTLESVMLHLPPS